MCFSVNAVFFIRKFYFFMNNEAITISPPDYGDFIRILRGAKLLRKRQNFEVNLKSIFRWFFCSSVMLNLLQHLLKRCPELTNFSLSV